MWLSEGVLDLDTHETYGKSNKRTSYMYSHLIARSIKGNMVASIWFMSTAT